LGREFDNVNSGIVRGMPLHIARREPWKLDTLAANTALSLQVAIIFALATMPHIGYDEKTGGGGLIHISRRKSWKLDALAADTTLAFQATLSLAFATTVHLGYDDASRRGLFHVPARVVLNALSVHAD
jgi:hypothetical protein